MAEERRALSNEDLQRLGRIGTRGAVRRTSQEEVEAARVRAAGRPAKPQNPALQKWAEGELYDRLSRTVSGPSPKEGRGTMYTLSHAQFAQWKETGEWEGDPRPREV